MEELADSLAAGFSVTKSEPGTFSTDKNHPRYQQFKPKGEVNSQNLRRKRFLEQQKAKRCDAQLLARKIAEDNLSDIEQEGDDFSDGSEMEDEVSKRTAFKTSGLCSYSSRPRKQHKTPRLMLSEWLVDVPEDFEASCYVVPCPVGKRNLVTASQGYCTAWTKFGVRAQYEFESALPHAYTILDCVYSPPENKYYCVDLLCWNGHPFLDCETEFRFFWLQTKFQENPEITKKSKFNRSPFEILPYFPCTSEGIVNAVSYFPPEKLDGVWFFHKQTHYHLGVTPLVGWLKPHMVPEVLNVQVPLQYSKEQAQINKQTTKQKKRYFGDAESGDIDSSKQTQILSKEDKWAMQSNANHANMTNSFAARAKVKPKDDLDEGEIVEDDEDPFETPGSVRMQMSSDVAGSSSQDYDQMMSSYIASSESEQVTDFNMNSRAKSDFSSDW
ncbi:snurportin-1-like isoform X2 [Symsagittifera roscoffensis]|uniref:snurportin-1-like isoform X2 n=1 Tax=Symsagittifera roscoffensis TaxID=84072 RepID=UPI00307C1376